MSTVLHDEAAFVAALDGALEAAAAGARPVGIVTLGDPSGGAASRLAEAAAQVLPAGGVVGFLGPDRVGLVLPGFGAGPSRELARRLAATFPGLRAGSASAEPDRPLRGPEDLIAEAEASAGPGPRTILVVEDEPAVGRVLEAFLSAAGGFDVHVARSGAEALERSRAQPPALVVLDLELPDVDGVELLARLRSIVPELQGIACSGKRPEAAAGAGFSSFFRKPFDMRALTAEVERLLRVRVLGAP